MANTVPDEQPGNETGIRRPRVESILAEALQKPLAVLQGGAGFGKTRAAADYLARSEYRTVWYNFTALDNNPSRFWESVSAAFALHHPALAEKMKLLGFPDSPQAFSVFLTDLTENLYTDRQAVVFVFDDLFLVDDIQVRTFLSNLIAARLENSCLLLLARSWPVAGIEAAVPMQLVGADDLCFTDEEAQALFASSNMQVSLEEAAAVNRYVSGWPIALSLLKMVMRREGTQAAMDALSVSKPRLFAMFEREIFSQYTPREQTLLILLSGLESFPRGMVQAVSGEKGRDLDQLMGGNLFIRYNASVRRFYFHPLYLEFLREKRHTLDEEYVTITYRRAAEWCRENGHYYDAINYYRRIGSHQEVWDILLLFEASRHTQTEAEFLIEQIKWLPDHFRSKIPMTRILLAVMLTNNLRFEEAAAVLDAVQTELEKTPPGSAMLGECYAARGLIMLGREENNFDVWFQKADDLLPNGSSRWNNKLRLGDLGPGLNLQSARAGELKKSLACFAAGVPPMTRVLHGAGYGLDHLCECEFEFLTGNARKAIEPAYQALYTAQSKSQYDIAGNALFMLLRIYTVLGEYQNIQDTLKHVREYQKIDAAAGFGIWDITFGWFYSELGETNRVAGWVRNAVQYGHAPVGIERALLVRLRCLIADGHYHEALALLNQFEAVAKSKSAVITQIYVQLSRAVTYHYLRQHTSADTALKAAYKLASGNGIVMPFIEYGNRTRSLLQRARETGIPGIPSGWLEEVHARASTFAKRHAFLTGRYHQQQNLRQNFGLSKREIHLLENLSQGLTREEISASMEISLNTVKSMTKQVFAKLGAINSADAVRIAMANQII